MSAAQLQRRARQEYLDKARARVKVAEMVFSDAAEKLELARRDLADAERKADRWWPLTAGVSA